ncbi:MAG TPA: hypothetical protein VNG93_02965 [Candidatus Dormibacteraeota bacterium]|nr:hypothetical protein [Candidatus Dormibacteraeota bacterium]
MRLLRAALYIVCLVVGAPLAWMAGNRTAAIMLVALALVSAALDFGSMARRQ